MGRYANALNEAMRWLASQSDTLFLGQSVCYPGTSIYSTLQGVPDNRHIELPVFEDVQLGMCIGLALQGFVPVCLYPRWDFVLLATNQLVNHLDKLPLMSSYRPRVIIRTAVGSTRPLDPQLQHRGDYTTAFRSMLQTVRVEQFFDAENILDSYQAAYTNEGSSLLVEMMDYLNEK